MSKASRAGNAVGKILTYILVVLLVVGAAGVIVRYIMSDEGISFYAEYDGKRYYSGVNESEITLSSSKTHTFSVNTLTGENADFSVSVLSSGEHNFTYVFDGDFYDFYVRDDTENNDYSSAFGLKKSIDGFSLTLPQDFSVEKAIEVKNGGDIELQGELQKDVPYFVISVSSGNDVLDMYFMIGESEMSITLNPPSIVF